jgi:hypothetical protein
MTGEERLTKLERALQWGGSTHAPADIFQLLKENKARYWEDGDGMIITELHDFPRLRAIHYWLIFGELKQCLGLEDQINTWARDEGCTVATACGRKGWGRVAAPTGWRPFHPNFWKPLVDGIDYGRPR